MLQTTSVRTKQLGSHGTDFHESCHVSIFRKIVEKLKFHYNLTTITVVLYMNTDIHFLITSRSFLLRMIDVTDNSFRGNQNTHFVFNNFFLSKIVPFWDNVEKYCRAGQGADDNMAHAHCLLVTWVYKHKLRICNTYRFSNAKVVARTRHNVTLYVHWLCYLNDPWPRADDSLRETKPKTHRLI